MSLHLQSVGSTCEMLPCLVFKDNILKFVLKPHYEKEKTALVWLK